MKTKFLPIILLQLILICKTNIVQAQVNLQDSLALVDLYNRTNGPNWKHHIHWLTKKPVSTWHGVTVSLGRVISITLAANRLRGAIPESFGNLTNLQSLNLNVNHLTSLPASFGNLANLQSLGLVADQLTSLPASFGNLVHLQFFNFNANPLISLPISFSNLANLQYLDLSFNQLTSLPNSFSNLDSLQFLYLSHNQLKSLPAMFGNLANLQSLDLSYNRLMSLPASFGNLANLQSLYLTSNHLMSLPNSFENLANLQTLYLDYNQLSGHLPHLFSSIKIVVIYYNDYTFDAGEQLLKRKNIYSSPQAKIPLHINGNTLSTYAGGTLGNNTYSWYKVGAGLQTSITGDSTYQPATSGSYYVHVTNAIVGNQLTLHSDTASFTSTLQNQNNFIIAKNNTLISNDKNTFTIYPNPAKSLLLINFSGMKDLFFSFQITNAEGEIITEKSVEAIKNASIDVSSFASGIYFITLSPNTNSITQKFVKE